ncbi:hypothetical protein [Paraburkholderia sp. BCC1884]|nr:hypothetical protein [Paraburkholderia sp. BCC1884]
MTTPITIGSLTAPDSGLADVARRHVHGFDCPNVCDLIDHAPFES